MYLNLTLYGILVPKTFCLNTKISKMCDLFILYDMDSSQKLATKLLYIRDIINDLFIVVGDLYGAVIFLGVNNYSNVQPAVLVERIVFYKERVAGMYHALPYALDQVTLVSLFHFILDIQSIHVPKVGKAQYGPIGFPIQK